MLSGYIYALLAQQAQNRAHTAAQRADDEACRADAAEAQLALRRNPRRMRRDRLRAAQYQRQRQHRCRHRRPYLCCTNCAKSQ